MSDMPLSPSVKAGVSSLPPAVVAIGRVLLGIIAVLVVWQAVIWIYAVPPYLAPSPVAVAQSLWSDWAKILPAILYTLGSTVLGLGIALVLAIVLAAIFTLSPAINRALLPLIIILRTAPVLAIAPILILIFGRGMATSLAVVVLVSFFPMMVNTTKGFRSTRKNALEMMRVTGATWWQTFTYVRFPYALPYIFTGVRMAAAGAILSAMLAEWLSGAPGIGGFILEASSFRNQPLMWAGVVTSVVTALLLFQITVWAERRVSR